MEDAVMEGGAKGRTVEAGRGTTWWSASWALFMKNPAMWLVFGVIFMLAMVVLGFIPVIGGLIASLLTQVLAGGWMLSVRKLESGGQLEVGDLFAGFKDKLNPLLVLGAIALGASIVIMLVLAVLGGGAMFGMMASGSAGSTGGMMAGAAAGLLAVIVGVGLGFVLAMALCFAPALVVLRGVAPVDAMKASWSACVSNIGAFLVYGLIWLAAAVVASIPFALGWIVLIPLTMLGLYCAYKDIFEG
jgi:uncharacterized membrane protein